MIHTYAQSREDEERCSPAYDLVTSMLYILVAVWLLFAADM